MSLHTTLAAAALALFAFAAEAAPAVVKLPTVVITGSSIREVTQLPTVVVYGRSEASLLREAQAAARTGSAAKRG
jgi:hypothetical protein